MEIHCTSIHIPTFNGNIYSGSLFPLLIPNKDGVPLINVQIILCLDFDMCALNVWSHQNENRPFLPPSPNSISPFWALPLAMNCHKKPINNGNKSNKKSKISENTEYKKEKQMAMLRNSVVVCGLVSISFDVIVVAFRFVFYRPRLFLVVWHVPSANKIRTNERAPIHTHTSNDCTISEWFYVE